jgi:checkpoint serine/threonine-protein kinase
VTVNQKGRTERVFVNLEAVYPNSSDVASIEELRAAYRGWLSKVWEPEILPKQDTDESPKLDDQTGDSGISMDAVSREVSEKLVIARDPPILDENGVTKDPGREGRSRRMKIKEVNETQISKLHRTMPL